MRRAAAVIALLLAGCAHFKRAPEAKEGRIYEASEAAVQAEITRWFAELGIPLKKTENPHVLASRVREERSGAVGNTLAGRRSGMGTDVRLETLDPGAMNTALEEARTSQLDDANREASREFHAAVEDAPIRLAETPRASGKSQMTDKEMEREQNRPIRLEVTTREGAWGKDRDLYRGRTEWRVETVPLAPNRTLVRIIKASSTQWDSSADQSWFVGSGLNAAKTANGAPVAVVDRDHALEARLAEHMDFSAAVEVLGDAEPEHVVPALVEAPKAPAPAPAAPSDEDGDAPIDFGCGVDVHRIDGSFVPGGVLMFGDLTGTDEAARAIAGVACNALDKGLEVTIALSITAPEQARINAFLASPGELEDRAALLAGPFWHRLWQDGRSSRAIVELLDTLRRWRTRGKSITALAVDIDVPGNVRTSFITSRILEHARANPKRLVLGFLSNTQVGVKAGTEWNPSYLPVGYRLLAAGLPVRSFDLAFVDGTQWTCRLFAFGKLKCGTWFVRAGTKQIDPDARDSDRAFIRPFQFRSKEGFDGLLWVGRVTASRPAFDDETKDEGDMASGK